jgi:hypothetical protein
MMSNDDREFSRQDEVRSSPQAGSNGISPSLIGLVVVVGLAVVFFFQNSRRIEINFWLFDWTTTIRWSITVSILLGVLLDRLVAMWWRHRRRAKDQSK